MELQTGKMMDKKSLLITTIFILIAVIVNTNASFIGIPARYTMGEYQIDFITISTVLAGFLFTMLGILLGLSSEELVKRISATSIIIEQVNTIVNSIILFMISIAISLILILKIDISVIKMLSRIELCDMGKLESVDSILYIMGIGYLISGIVFFTISVKKFYKLIAHIYNFNRSKTNGKTTKLKQALESDEKENLYDDEGELIQQ